MSTHSTDGRAWAKLSECKPGTKLQTDSGFTCGIENSVVTVVNCPDGLAIHCDEGFHNLDGQADDGEHLVGLWPATSA